MTLPSWPADRPLRAWQQAAAAAVFSHPGDAFLASATPAAGKTTFGLHVAHRMLAEGRVARVAVVAPTTHIARQWAADAGALRHRPRAEPAERRRAGAARPPRRRRHLPDGRGRPGRAPAPLRRGADAADRRRAAPHGRPGRVGAQHGRGVRRARASGCCCRARRSAPTTRAIPWVTYDADGVSEPDYAYGYTDALLDHVCRPVTFHLNDGEMEWMSDGRRRSADFTVGLPGRRGGAPPAHRARPGRRLDRARAARGGAAAGADPRRRPPGRRRPRRSPPTRSTPRRSPSGSRASPASGRRSSRATRRTRRPGSPASPPGTGPGSSRS